MTAKEYLNQAYWLDRQIDCKLEQLRSLNALATRTTGVISENPVSHTRDPHRMEDVIVKIISMEKEINADVDRLVGLKTEIQGKIREMPCMEYQLVLDLRYMCFKNWEEIAEKMHCSKSNVFKTHARAVREFEKMYSEI